MVKARRVSDSGEGAKRRPFPQRNEILMAKEDRPHLIVVTASAGAFSCERRFEGFAVQLS
jgi:hypothetical protein